MKRIVIIVIILITGLLGCSKHYYRINGDTLHLFLKEPRAQQVSFASSMDGFELHNAIKFNSSTWIVRVPADKEFKYFYLIDGAVVAPFCRYKEKDDFGSENCIFMPSM
jgi:hypothetical protein